MRAIDGDAHRDRLRNLADDDWNQSTTTSWAEAFAECADMVDDAPTIEPEPHWIPCSERLPNEYGNYLATMDDGDVQECTYSPEKNTPFMRGGWSTCEADGIVYLDIAEVIAWMPLPEPYKEGEGC